jgi:hypothetical protein
MDMLKKAAIPAIDILSLSMIKGRKRIMKMTNIEIYTNALGLNKAFSDNTQKLPIKINFYLQKNKATLTALA